jgi:hypothetical protein
MELVATFPYTANVELVLTELERFGIPKTGLMAIPLQGTAPYLTVKAVGNEGGTNWDYGFVLGTVGMLLGSIYGFVLPGGPVLWAMGGLVGFFLIGVGITVVFRNRQIRRNRNEPQVVIWIRCEDRDTEQIRNMLISHAAVGIGEVRGAS